MCVKSQCAVPVGRPTSCIPMDLESDAVESPAADDDAEVMAELPDISIAEKLSPPEESGLFLEFACSTSHPEGPMELEQLSDSDLEHLEETDGVRGCDWNPGRDCGSWVVGKLGLGEQGQVLITNLYLSLRKLPASVNRTILDYLRPGHGATRNFADRVSAALLGVSRSTARYVFDRLQRNRWQPVRPQVAPSASEGCQMVSSATPPLSDLDAMKVRVREVLAVCSGGRPDVDYATAMSRLKSHGLDVGDKHLSRKFVEPVEVLATTAAMAQAAHLLGVVSPSLGIASDIALVWDGVSIGARNFSRYETLYLIGCTHMVWDGRQTPSTSCEPSCWTKASLLAGPSAGQKHTGQEQVDLLFNALEVHPARLDKSCLRARLAAIGSDGAAARGGPDSHHGTTGASERFWEAVHASGAPPAAEWDLFHRIDAGTSKAVSCSPAALEIFDIARILGQLFGVGDGRVIFRAAAAAVGAKHLRVPDQGGSRKVVALARCVSRLLESLPAYQAGLHARRGQAESRRGSQSKAHLVSIGRRVTALGFVVFAVAVNDVLKQRVVPLALRAQAVGGSSWEMDRFCQSTMRHLKQDAEALKDWRRWVFVSALMQQYLTSQELRRFWFVLIPLWWRRLPTLATNGFNLLHRQEFNNCMLSVVHQVDQSAYYMLSPKCQCACMQQAPRADRPRLGTVRVGNREIRVPEWVSHSVYGRSEWEKRGFIGPRFVRVPKELRSKSSVAGVPGRFRQGSAAPRCVVSFVFAAAVDEVLAAISEAIAFVTNLVYYLSAYSIGSVGIARGTRTMFDHAQQCWNWDELLVAPPKQEHYRAFFSLYESLLPTLRHTQWPSEDRFGWLEHSWPGLRRANGAFEQYRLLMQRVRAAASRKPTWRSSDAWLVEPVWSAADLAASIGAKFTAAGREHKCCILHLIRCFLQGPPSGIAGGPFKVAAADLARVSFGRTARTARAKKKSQMYSRRSMFASLASRHTAGRLVRVLRPQGSADEEQIAATLLSDAAFVLPEASGNHCWHVVRVYMRVRMMRAPESCCERWGSFLHSLWDPVAGWEPHRMVSRLLIKEAGFDGIAREDVVVEIAQALLGWMGKTTRSKGCPASSQQQPVTTTENLPVRVGLREHPICPGAWRQGAKPAQLLKAAARAVDDAVRLGRGTAMAALPAFAENARTTRQNRANSVVQASLRRFLESEDGRQWQADRKALFGAAAAE